MYKTAMLGCGGRARGHADAYRFVKRCSGSSPQSAIWTQNVSIHSGMTSVSLHATLT